MPVPAPLNVPASQSAELAAKMQSVDIMGADSGDRIAMDPNEAFFLRHHPMNWDVGTEGLSAPTWLPELTKASLVPGAHLMRTRKDNEPASKAFEYSQQVDQRNGWTHLDPRIQIPAECLPAGVAPGSYIRAIPCAGPRSGKVGLHHLEAWNVPMQSVPGTKQRFKFDRASYNRWRLWLVTSGQIAAPSADAMEAVQQSRSGRASRIAALPIPEDLRKQRVATETAITTTMAKAEVPELAAEPRKKGA